MKRPAEIVIPLTDNADMSLASTPKGDLITTELRARLELRLEGGPTGAFPLDDSDALKHLQDAVLRLAKALLGRAGRDGRSPREVEELTRLHLVGIEPGSTVIVIGAPVDRAVPFAELDIGLEALDAFEDALEAAGRGELQPEPVDDLSRISMRLFLESLSRYRSLQLVDERPDREARSLSVDPRRATLAFSDRDHESTRRTATASGLLYAVDIKNHSYRLEDDLGRTIAFEFAQDSEQLERIRSLVGRRVDVQGEARVDSNGVVRQLTVTSITASPTLTAQDYFDFDLEAAMEAAAPVRSLEDLRIPDLTPEEADAFWRALHG